MTTVEKIKRKLQAIYIDTTPSGTTPTYDLIGVNVSEATINYNPQTNTEQDIISDTASTEIVGYQPNVSITQQVSKGDPAFEFVNALRRQRATLADSYTSVILVDLYDETTQNSGIYFAEKQNCSIQIDSYGGAGSEPLSISFTINFRGDGIDGKFTLNTKTFVADPPTGESGS